MSEEKEHNETNGNISTEQETKTEKKQKKKEKRKKRSLFHKIINVFLHIGIVLFVILLLLFGFTQTSTFREWLRDTIVEEVNGSLHGQISIESIDGTIFTSLILRGTSLQYEQDTIAAMRELQLFFSPHFLLFKEIHVRKLQLNGADIKLETDQDGVLNLTKVFPSGDEPERRDTVKGSPFPFDIDIEDFELMNIYFSHQDYANIGSDRHYQTLNTSDLRIKNLYLDCTADVSLENSTYALDIAELYVETNLKPLSHVTFEGNFFVDTTGAYAEGVSLMSNNTDIVFDAIASNINLFNSPGTEELGRMGVYIDMDAERFSFNDLSALLPSLTLLQGEISTVLRANGTLSELTIALLEVGYRKTDLRLEGTVFNIHSPQNLTIDALFTNSVIYQPDVAALLPEIGIPEFTAMPELNIDTLSFSGMPADFSSRLDFVLGDEGVLLGDVALNFNADEPEYSINLSTQKINLAPFTGMNALLSVDSLIVKGKGFSPETMNTSIYLSANNSTLGTSRLDRFFFTANAANGLINIDTAFAVMGNQRAGINASINMRDMNKPYYSYSIRSEEVNIGALMGDKSLTTNLNLQLDGEGTHFKPDLMTAGIVLKVDSSTYQYKPVNPFTAEFSIKNPGAKEKSITLKSDITDIELKGAFEFADFTGVVADELTFISGSILEKANSYFPFQEDTVFVEETLLPQSLSEVEKQREEKRPYIDCQFTVAFKDLTHLTPFIDSRLTGSGNIRGDIKNNEAGFSFDFDTDSIDVFFGSGDEQMKLQQGYLNMLVSHGFPVYSIDDIFADIVVKAGTVSLGNTDSSTYFKYAAIEALLEASNINVSASASMNDEIRTGLSFSSDFNADTLIMNYDSLRVAYRKFDLVSRETFTIAFHEDAFSITDFNLFHNDVSGIFIDGTLSQQGDQNIHLDIKNFKSDDIARNFLDGSGSLPDAYINLQADLTGDFADPDLYLQISADSLQYNQENVGTFYALMEYDNELVTVDAKLLASMKEFKDPKLYIYGTLPMNLALIGDVERIRTDEPFDLTFKADSLQLNVAENMLPGLKDIQGILNSSLKLSGYYPDLTTNGNLSLTEGSLVPAANNLRYSLDMEIASENSVFTLEQFKLENTGDVENRGALTGSGTVQLDGFEMQSAELKLGGDLSLLSEASKGGELGMSGELFIATDGDITFTTDGEKSELNAGIILVQSDVVYEMQHSAYSRSAENFIYIYGAMDSMDVENDTLKESELAGGGNPINPNGADTDFNYDISVTIEKDAYATFIFSPEANQSLRAQLEGELRYSMINGERNFRGELRLLDDSKLDLMNLKTFNASGSVRFDNDLTNPYLDITATYRSYYTFSDDYGGEREREVAVKIKLKGNLDYVTRNFSQLEDNIALYIGTDNIEEEVPAGGYDKADAVWFVLTGKLPQDLTQEDRQTAANEVGFFESSATSIAGSLVGGLLNAYLGDIVKSFNVRQGASGARFNISGNVEGIRYTIGGSTEIFDNLADANIRIEYPIFFDKNLLIRLERKQDYGFLELDYSSYEMVNEIGLKYRIGF